MKKLLVSMLVNLGDVIMMTAALNLLRRGYPELKITALIRPEAEELMRGNPAADEAIVYAYKSGSALHGFAELRGRLRAGAFDAFLSLDRRPRGAMLAWAAGIKKRLGPDMLFENCRPEFWTRLLFTERVRLGLAERAGDQMEMFQEVARRAFDIEGQGRVTLPPEGPEEAEFARGILAGANGPAIGLCVRVRDPLKQWPPENFLALMRRLKNELGAFIYVTGSPGDRAFIDGLLAADPGLALNLAGRTGLRQLAALAGRGALFITPDNGTAHLVSAGGAKKMIVILVGTPRLKIAGSCPRGEFFSFPPSSAEAGGLSPSQVEEVFAAAKAAL